MLDRLEPILKIVCVTLAALLLWRIVRLAVQSDPLGHASIPPLPTLVVKPEGKAGPTNSAAKPGTNTTAQAAPNPGKTNAVTGAKAARRSGNFAPNQGGPTAAAQLPASIQSQVDRIKESEILGPFMRPQPMALLGIADDDVFLRAPDGQSGLVKQGGELGGVKLIRIGINRVLVEQDGKQQELTLFSGLGSESLLPAETNNSTNAAITLNHKENH